MSEKSSPLTLNIRPGFRFIKSDNVTVAMDLSFFLDGAKIWEMELTHSPQDRKPHPAHYESFPVKSPGRHRLRVESLKGKVKFEKELLIEGPIWVDVHYTFCPEGHPRAAERGFIFQTYNHPTYYR